MRVGCSWKKAACAALIRTVAAHANYHDKHTQDLLGNHNHHHEHHDHDHHHHSHVRGLENNGEITHKCGTPDPSPSEKREVREAIESWMSEKASAAEIFGYDEPVQECIPIPTYVFIIQHEDGEKRNQMNKMKGREKEQIRKMNDDVKGPYNFELEDIIYISNTTWWNFDEALGNSNADREMRTQLRKGGAETLNIYYINTKGTGYVGWATFPWKFVNDPKIDGVVVDHKDGFPGSTLVHEVGHWLGLYHTFEDGCAAGADEGDEVADTPAQKSSTDGCPKEGRDSCPNLPGKDPIENFMDYSDCGKEFSPGQYDRIKAMWQIYRSPSRLPATGSPTTSIPTGSPVGPTVSPTTYSPTSSPAMGPTMEPTTSFPTWPPTTSYGPSIEKLTRCSDNAPTSPAPSVEPTDEPSTSYEPTALANTAEPTADPTPKQTTDPTANPTPKQTTDPTANPTPKQTTDPTANPTPKQTTEPTANPTPKQTTEPTADPTPKQTTEPTANPTPKQTIEPTAEPTTGPTPSTTEPTPKQSKGGKGRKIGNGDKTGKGRKTSKGVKTGKGVKSDSRASGKGDKAHKGGKEANTVKVLGENI